MAIDDEIRKAVLHDIKHKPFKLKHDLKEKTLDTTADRDAANMSRYHKAYDDLDAEFLSKSFIFTEQDMSEHTRKEYAIFCLEEYVESVAPTPELHMKLLEDLIVGKFNEVTSMPFTSLKYHTLLVCALHYNYKMGKDFQDLYLHCTKEQPKDIYTTIFHFDNLWLAINSDINGAKIGAALPFFGQTIGRLDTIPLPEFLVDNLRRFRSWSTGLQYLEDALTFIKIKKMEVA